MTEEEMLEELEESLLEDYHNFTDKLLNSEMFNEAMRETTLEEFY